MPLWQIFAPKDAFNDNDKEQLSQRITSVYVDYGKLPAFYVVIVFHEAPANTIYVGGKAANNFVRVLVDHVARQMDGAEVRAACMALIEEKLAPLVKDRGYDWEVHIDETPMDLWRTQGLVPPPPESDMEKLWAKENKPIPYEIAK